MSKLTLEIGQLFDNMGGISPKSRVPLLKAVRNVENMILTWKRGDIIAVNQVIGETKPKRVVRMDAD